MREKLEPISVGRAEDLTGQKFGHLSVLYRVANRQGRPTWQCQCDSGEFFTAIARDLKNGRTVSCGCSSNEGHIKNRIGQRFGKLLVLEQCSYRSADGEILWKCKCDCGNIVDIRASNIQRQASCGMCSKRKDITGQKFGKLIAIKYHHTSPTKRTIWECKCDCGNISYVDITDLTSGKTQSCGCQAQSHGEARIETLLTEGYISFEREKTFDDLRYIDTAGKPRFDFFVDGKYLIEYDGIQHYQENEFFNVDLQTQRKRDNIKTIWCKEHKIPLIRIPYTHLQNLTLDDLRLETSKYIMDEGPAPWEDK